jgi:hypothetical protein
MILKYFYINVKAITIFSNNNKMLLLEKIEKIRFCMRH